MDSIGYLGIFILALGLAGAVLCGLAYRASRARSAAAERWLTATGVVTESAVGRGGTNRHPYYAPSIRYDYDVHGRKRHGARIRFGMVTMRTRGAAQKMLDRYPVGAAVPVRYDPDNPDESVLEPAVVGRNLLIATLFCGLVLVAGTCIVVLAVLGYFSSAVSGHWHVVFSDDGITYAGDIEAAHGAGPLTVAYATPQGSRRAREDCTLTRNGQHVLVRCANPQMVEGTGNYTADNFDLTFDGESRLTGSASSHGGPIGPATFTR